MYTISDPRAVYIENHAEKIAQSVGRLDELNLLKRVARIVPTLVKEKTGKTVCANVDFYSGFIYECMGIPRELLTPIFAMARVSVWSAH